MQIKLVQKESSQDWPEWTESFQLAFAALGGRINPRPRFGSPRKSIPEGKKTDKQGLFVM